MHPLTQAIGGLGNCIVVVDASPSRGGFNRVTIIFRRNEASDSPDTVLFL